jgi:RNA polymerase sigma factor (TIGR02999 family)
MIFNPGMMVRLMAGGRGLITRYLLDWRSGDSEALTRLTSAVYAELRGLAGAILRSRAGDPIQPTELVHELYLELPGLKEVDFESRAHFMNLSARIMRNILIDHARKRMTARRGGQQPVTLRFDPHVIDPALEVDVLLINEALDRFAQKYPRQAKVVELRFFGGLTAEETSDAMNGTGGSTSLRSVERDWNFAKAWLHNAVTAR